MNRKLRAGTTLVELLVVIVVFLIGILGVVQLFPAGFAALTTTRNTSIANELARALIESVKSRADQLPDQIVPVRYTYIAGNSVIQVDYRRNNSNLAPLGVGIDANGNVLDASSNALGPWGRLSGANTISRVVGEGGRVPAPRNVNGRIGGLMVLQFAPIRYDVNNITLDVYGNDLLRRYGQPGIGGFNRTWEYFVSDEDGNGSNADTLFLPVAGRPGTQPYRISFNFYVDNGGVFSQKVVLDFFLPQGFAQSTAFPGYYEVDVAALVGTLGLLTGSEVYAGIDADSVKVQRRYYELQAAEVFSSDPYEYDLLDPNVGVLLFNPAGYNYQERRNGNQRVPLLARVDYDVYDWRIIRDEFRIANSEPFQQKLILNSLMVSGGVGADGKLYNGLNVLVQNGTGGTQNIDLILMDVDTGGVYLHDPSNPANPTPPPTTSNDFMGVDPARSSYMVDKSAGIIRFADADVSAPGLQLRLIPPGGTVPQVVTADGRRVRALYQAKGEWAVQVLKAPSNYTITFNEPVSATYYVGASSTYGGQPTRIYFPGSDIGKKVTIGEIWYTNPSGLQVMRDVDFLVTATPADPLGVAYVDIRTIDQNAIGFDFSNGYAVRRVKGASVSARVLWNPAYFSFTNDPVENMTRFEQWSRNWRRTTVETYLEKTVN